MSDSRLIGLTDRYNEPALVDVNSIVTVYADAVVLAEAKKVVHGSWIEFGTGRSLFVRESPTDIMELIKQEAYAP